VIEGRLRGTCLSVWLRRGIKGQDVAEPASANLAKGGNPGEVSARGLRRRSVCNDRAPA